MVLAGDMRQCLVVVPGASRAGIVKRTVNQCPLWNQFEVMELTRNMHVLTSGDERLIAWDYLIIGIGIGTCGTPTVDGNIVTFPEEMCLKIKQNTAEDNNCESKSVAELINKVFPDWPLASFSCLWSWPVGDPANLTIAMKPTCQSTLP